MNNYMEKNNLVRLTIIAYLLTLITGIAVILPFIIKQPAAAYFHSTMEYTGYVFSFFMIGMLIMQFCNGFIVKLISIKNEIYLMSAIYLICIILMYFISTASELIPILIVLGLCFGIIVTIPNFLIVHAFAKKERSSRLNRLDFSFSIGSMIYPIIAGYMIAAYLSWQSVYLSVLIIIAVIVILTVITKFPNLNIANDVEKAEHSNFSKWNLNVYLMGIMMFLYFVSYVGYTYWITEYLVKDMHIPETSANYSITLFWLLYAIGCFVSSLAVKKIPVNKYITISDIIAFIAYFLVMYSNNVPMLYISISLLGLGCATIYSSGISYSTMLVSRPSPRIVSFIITSSGVATFVGEFYSSYIVGAYGLTSIIIVSAILMLAVAIIMVIVTCRDKVNTKESLTHISH